MEETISIKELFGVIRKRIWWIAGITFAAVVVSAVISYFVLTPIYQSTTQLLVSQKNTKETMNFNSEIQANLQLVNTYNEIIKSPAILNKVSEELNLPVSSSMITVGNSNQSQVVNVSVQSENPEQASEIANKTAEVFQREIRTIMNIDNVTILSPAVEPMSPIKPNPITNMAIALVIGLMAGIGLSFLFEYLDNTIKTEQDIETLLELPVLGSIAKIEEPSPKKNDSNKDERSESIGA